MKIFQGTFTAIITPFNDDKSIDYESFEKIINMQIEGGVDGIVFLGTTGESPTISADEHKKLINWTIKTVNKRTKVILNTGSNCTEEAIKFSQVASNAGVDGILSVSPYYNKPTQEGLYQHFKTIADNIDVPMIIYNIFGRCAVNVSTQTIIRLAEHKNIIAVKESSGDIQQIMDVIRKTPDNFCVLSGDDAITYPLIACGGDGVISVISNCMPKTISNYVRECLNGNMESTRKTFYKLIDIMRDCFIETNPIPIKEIMAELGYCKPVFRLPMCRISENNLTKIKEMAEFVKSIEGFNQHIEDFEEWEKLGIETWN